MRQLMMVDGRYGVAAVAMLLLLLLLLLLDVVVVLDVLDHMMSSCATAANVCPSPRAFLGGHLK